jgi:hypothetical protein
VVINLWKSLFLGAEVDQMANRVAFGTFRFEFNVNCWSVRQGRQILDKYRIVFKITEETDNSEVARYRERINIFQSFLTKAILSMNVSTPNFTFYSATA